MSCVFNIVIPARMASQRLPGKPLAKIAGKPLVEHVYDRARLAGAQSVVVATDAEEIRQCAESFGATVVMTSEHHQSGSDRIAECAQSLGWADDQVLVNLQGDEPLMPAACLRQVAELLARRQDASAASLYRPVESAEEAADPNSVKVVTSNDGMALYFSRSLIPFPRQAGSLQQAIDQGQQWFRHIGLYAYRVEALRAFTELGPSPLESTEKLEQLRFLEAGRSIVMAAAEEPIPAGVDTPEDLERVRKILQSGR